MDEKTTMKAQALLDRYAARPAGLARAIGAMGQEVMMEARERMSSIMSVMAQAGSVESDLETLAHGSDLARLEVRHRRASQTARLRLEREHLGGLTQRIEEGSQLLTTLSALPCDPMVASACRNRLEVFAVTQLNISQTVTALDILLHR